MSRGGGGLERLARSAAAGLARLLGGLGWFRPGPGGESGRLRILVVKPDHMGDLVMATAALQAVRDGLPGAEILVAAKRPSQPVLAGHPAVDRVVDLDAPWSCHSWEATPGWRAVFGTALALRGEGLDATLCLHDDLRSGLWSLAAGARLRVGFSGRAPAGLFTVAVPARGEAEHTVDAGLRAARALVAACRGEAREGPAAGPGPGQPLPRVVLTPAEREAGTRLLGGSGAAVVLHPGAGNPAKRLGLDVLRELARRLPGETGSALRVVAGPGDQALAAELAAAAGPGAATVAPLDLRALAGALASARLVVAHDSGPAHLAAAVGAPVVAVFGPTDPVRWGPRGLAVRVVRRVECERPCTVAVRECACFRRLTADEVLEAVRELSAATRE